VLGQVGPGVLADEVHLVGLVKTSDELDGVVQHRHDVGEGVAEEPGDADRHVDARTAELGQVDDLEVVDPPGHVVPFGLYAEQREHLCDVVARGAHGAGAPHREADRGGVLPGLFQVALHQRLRHRLACLPGEPGRDRAGVHGVEVAAGREHVDQSAQRGAGRACRDETTVEGVQQGIHLVGGATQPRDHLGRGEGERRPDGGVVVQGVDGVRVPARRGQGLDEASGLRLEVVDLSGARSLGQPQSGPQTGNGVADAAPDLRGAQHREHEVDQGVAGRRLTEDVETVADLDVLDLAEPAVDVQDEVVELLVVRPLVQSQVPVQLGGLHQLPDLPADRRQLGRVHCGDVAVLIEELLEASDVAVGLRTGHRRDQMVHDRRVGAPLGLGALPGVVDQERIEQGQVAQDGVGAALRGEGGVLPG